MTTQELTADLIEESDDPAKQYGNLESWSGQEVYVLRNAKGHFVTWRKAESDNEAAGQVAVTDGGEDKPTFNDWVADLKSADIKGGDKITLKTDSGVDRFDGKMDAVAKSDPTESHWLEIESGSEGRVLVVPDSDSETGVVLCHVQGVRMTGALDNKRVMADVKGVEKRE